MNDENKFSSENIEVSKIRIFHKSMFQYRQPIELKALPIIIIKSSSRIFKILNTRIIKEWAAISAFKVTNKRK